MTHSNPIVLTASLLISLLCAAGSAAQEKLANPAPRNLAIEIVGRKHLIPAPVLEPPARGGYIETVPPSHLPGWQQPADALPLTRIRIRSTLEGDGVRIKVAVVFDDSEPADAPGPKYGEREQPLASYLVQEGETATVSELTRFGFEPMVLRVVKHQPRAEQPAPIMQPQIINPLQSVTVVSFESKAPPSTFYGLTLRNLSVKSIIALDVYIVEDGGSSGQRMEAPPEHPLMPPGATYETSISMGGWLTPQGSVPDMHQPTMTIGTVVFADGTYEGEAKTAAEIMARRRGQQKQLARVLPLLQSFLDAPPQDATTALEKLKAQVSMLRIDVDPTIVDELLARFPELPQKDNRTWLTAMIMDGYRNGRMEAMNRLREIEAMRAHKAESFDFQQALRAAKEQLEKRIGSR
jgi:hypothetical protein